MEGILQPMGKSNFLESQAIKWPKEGLKIKPHLIKDKMGKDAKGKDKKPSLPIAPVEPKSDKGNNDEKDNGMAKYPAVTIGVPEEELPDRFINDVREEWADEKESYVYMSP